MPATGKNALTLGRSVVDLSILEEGTPEGLRKVLELFYQTIVGEGWPSPAQDGDDVYQNVYAQYNGATWTLHAGSPDDPTNPDLISVSAAGSTTIAVEDVGGLVDGATDTIQFIGNVTVTPDGGGHVTVDIAGGATNSFVTINVDGGTPAVADSATDTLNLVSGNMIDITLSGADELTFAVDLSEHASYAVSENMLLGHVDDSATVAEWKTVADWLKTLPSYNASNNQYLNNDNGTIQWKDAVAC